MSMFAYKCPRCKAIRENKETRSFNGETTEIIVTYECGTVLRIKKTGIRYSSEKGFEYACKIQKMATPKSLGY